jgi:hypothetical protein
MFGCTPADGTLAARFADGTSARSLGGSVETLHRFPAGAEVVNLLRCTNSRHALHARAVFRNAGASANCAALRPASRPKVAPDIRPVPLA